MKPAVSEKSCEGTKPDGSWPTLIQGAAQQVFELMVGSAIHRHPSPPAEPSGSTCSIVGELDAEAEEIHALVVSAFQPS